MSKDNSAILPDYPQLKKQLDGLLTRVNGFDQKNQQAIMDFHQSHNVIQCQINGQIRNLITLVQMVEKHKLDLSNIDENKINSINAYWLEHCTPSSRNRNLSTLKVFLRHQISQTQLTKSYKERLNDFLANKSLKKMDLKKNTANKLQNKDLLTQADIMNLIRVSSPKYKAIWAMLYGTSCRIGALRALKRQDLSYEPDGSAIVNITSKGQVNSIWCRSDLSLFLKQWLDQNPNKKETDLVFPSKTGKTLSENSVLKQLRIAGTKAGIQKRLFPHLFRHSSISELLNSGFNPMFLKRRAWGNETSRQLELTYGHLDTARVNDAMRDFSGQTKPKEPPKFELAKKVCFACGKDNPFNAEFCSCGQALDAKKALEEVYWRELEKKEMQARMTTLEWKLEQVLATAKR